MNRSLAIERQHQARLDALELALQTAQRQLHAATVAYERALRECPACAGEGEMPSAAPTVQRCASCNGSGKRRSAQRGVVA